MSNVDVDFREIESLFTVIEKCVNHSGKFTGIMSEASNRLQEIDEDIKEAQREAKAEAEAARVAALPRAVPAAEEPEPTEPPQTGRRV